MKNYLLNIFSYRLLEDEINKITSNSTNIIKFNYDESSIDEILQECLTFSLLNEEKYVIVKKFKLNSEAKKFEKYLETPNSNTTLILVFDSFDIKSKQNKENPSIDKRSKIYKIINSKGNVIEINNLKQNDILKRIANYCKTKNINIEKSTLLYLLEKVNYKYDIALSEIDKLLIITKKIDINSIDKYVIKVEKEENYDLCDSIINKKYSTTFKLFQSFINNKCEVIPFISLLASKYRLIYNCFDLNGTNETIGQFLKVHPYSVKLAKENMRFYKKEELENILIDLCELDYKLKTLNVNPYALLELFLIKL